MARTKNAITSKPKYYAIGKTIEPETERRSGYLVEQLLNLCLLPGDSATVRIDKRNDNGGTWKVKCDYVPTSENDNSTRITIRHESKVVAVQVFK